MPPIARLPEPAHAAVHAAAPHAPLPPNPAVALERPEVRVSIVMPAPNEAENLPHGKGDALAGGFSAAAGDIVVTIDAAGSTDPAEMPRFFAALVEGVDFAKGLRSMPGAGSDDVTPEVCKPAFRAVQASC